MNTTTTYTEAQLVALLRQRNPAGFHYLYQHYSGALMAIIKTMIPTNPQAVEDVWQETVIRIFRKIDLYNPDRSRLYTWMAQIARNTAIDWLRKEGRQPASINQKQPEDVTVGIAPVSADSTGLWNWVNKLDPPERAVVIFAYMHGLTQEAISEHLQIPLGTIKSRTRSALKKLRQLMTDTL